MDFKNYYLNQAGNGIPYFQGTQYQRGYGLGGVFRKIFRWIMPIVKEHALPVSKTVGKEILKTAANIAHDTLNGNDVKQSINKRLGEAVKNLGDRIHEGEGLILKPGLSINSFKRKLKKTKNKKLKKRKLDIFDKK